MKYLPLAVISFLAIVLGVFMLTTDIGSANKTHTIVPIVQHEGLESILGDSTENRISIQYTTDTELPTSLTEPSTIQVVQPDVEQAIP